MDSIVSLFFNGLPATSIPLSSVGTVSTNTLQADGSGAVPLPADGEALIQSAFMNIVPQDASGSIIVRNASLFLNLNNAAGVSVNSIPLVISPPFGIGLPKNATGIAGIRMAAENGVGHLLIRPKAESVASVVSLSFLAQIVAENSDAGGAHSVAVSVGGRIEITG